jgi:RecA/RadA recombinase
MSLLDKIKKNSSIKETAILSKSKFFEDKDLIHIGIPALDIANSGDVDGGFAPGHTMWAGPSKNFKTGFTLLMARAYQQKYPDGVILFYDSEFGSPQAYFKSFGIETDRVIHTPVTDVEQLKFDIMNQLNGIERGDRVMIVIDSIGNLASKKEVEDALDGKSVVDMTRAKGIKSLFRMVTPHLNLKDIPLVSINHTYKTLELYSKDVVGGGTGSYYSADNIFILGRQQEKNKDNEICGYTFVINVEKSRFVREKSKIPFLVTFDGGINKYAGMLEIAQEVGFVVKVKIGNSNGFSRVNVDTGEIEEKKWKEIDTDVPEFWDSILNSSKFKAAIRAKYQFASEFKKEEDSHVEE